MNLNTASTRKGRERACTQCGNTFRSIRSNARFCSAPCRKKAGRGTAPTGGPKAGPANFSPITKALYLTGYVGRIGPDLYSLVVDPNEAYAELAYQFDRKGWGMVSREEFDADLKANGIHGFNTRSPETLERNRYRARLRERIARAA
uniref:hypothetical protein n=1 Tax=uncultured Altererythrobacter sp. TaxID=500840 RepID=UPI00260D7366|nr:hypothetical protein [uncultured Altererythrobacter sp.]